MASSKLVASDPIRTERFESWEDLKRSKGGLMVLNGDSSRLPLPDGSVDAVVTDPPYFDFVHYSELSDFFFAWLSPVLKERHAWFDRADSSDEGEVQHKEPATFARQLGLVFAECCRVLKDDGTLTFSFHHSRAEGWASIHEAVKASGMQVVATHAVHAELRGASPKSAAVSPISLDAILVCRKRDGSDVPSYRASTIVRDTGRIAKGLVEAGMRLSDSDLFVIAASQALVATSGDGLGFTEMCLRLDALRSDLDAAATSAGESSPYPDGSVVQVR